MVKFKSFQEFWIYYLKQHSKKSTRNWHFVGTTFVFVFLLTAVITGVVWYIFLAPIVAYLFAWTSHFFIEGNTPATFGHPFWSLRADFKMYWLMLTRRLNQELMHLPLEDNIEM